MRDWEIKWGWLSGDAIEDDGLSKQALIQLVRFQYEINGIV